METQLELKERVHEVSKIYFCKEERFLITKFQTKVLTLEFFEIFYEKQIYIEHILVHFWVGYSSCYSLDRRKYHYFHI